MQRSMMQRAKNTDTSRPPRPGGSWLLGLMIGGAIMTMATGAAAVGAGMAIRDAGMKGGA